MPKILHFADAHIDMAGQGRRDADTGLPVRMLDFLKALDTIIDTAIAERVDLVIFAGDAYKDRTPPPTYQREWGRRMMRLSRARIPTVMLVGNHDLSPATGRAHAMQELDTLEVPFLHVIGKPTFLQPADLDGVPVQVLALPWVFRSGLMATLGLSGSDPSLVHAEVEARLTELLHGWLDRADPDLPIILAAHATVQGAKYGGERSVMLGSDLVLPGSLVCDPRLDYAALGHIHKAQNLNEGLHPPVIYPGSIERVDFGEAADDKFFVIAHVERGSTQVEWRKLAGRRFIDRKVRLVSTEGIEAQWQAVLPATEDLSGAILRLEIEYPRAWEPYLDEQSIRRYCEPAFEFHLLRRPQDEARLRLPGDQAISSLSPLQLLDVYWKSTHSESDPPEEWDALQKLAVAIIASAGSGSEEGSD
jgi:exonuclease SbcD